MKKNEFPTYISNVSLKPLNTLGIDVRARMFAEIHSDADAVRAVIYSSQKGIPLLIIGSGSNLVLMADIEGLVLRMLSRGIRILSDDGVNAVVESEAGEVWHSFVRWTLKRGLFGLENLSLIPGTVGAAPIQNIGAYGVEVKDSFYGLTALDTHTGKIKDFNRNEPNFRYRDSIFKRNNRWIILRVRFLLSRSVNLRLNYGQVSEQLAKQGIVDPTPYDVSNLIGNIRKKKLPDPKILGSVGSFFKNPTISANSAEDLISKYPSIISYPLMEGVKLSAAWLIEFAGWKGFREASVGVYELQPLVIVNYGSATGSEVITLARRIQDDIGRVFNIELDIEPDCYPPAKNKC